MPLNLNDQDLNVMWSHNLNASEICVYKYGYNRGIGKEIDIYPDEFRAWQQKHSHNGKCMSNRQAWRSIRNLCDRGFGEIKRSGYGRIQLVLYSLDFVCGRERKTKTETPKPDPEKANNSEAHEKTRTRQQQLILTKQICKSFGVNYRLEKDWWEIASHGLDKIKATLDRMMIQLSNSRTTIYNPCGWLKVALRDNYYLDTPSSQNSVSLCEKMFFWSQEKLLDLTGSLPTRPAQSNLFNQKKYVPRGT